MCDSYSTLYYDDLGMYRQILNLMLALLLFLLPMVHPMYLATIFGASQTSLQLDICVCCVLTAVALWILQEKKRAVISLTVRKMGLNDYYHIAALFWVFFLAMCGETLFYSKEVGGFAAGLLLPTSAKESRVVGRTLSPVRSFFLVFFYAGFGLRMDPQFIFSNFLTILPFFLATSCMKFVCAFAGFAVVRPAAFKDSAWMSVCVSQVTEFGFLIAAKSYQWNAITHQTYFEEPP